MIGKLVPGIMLALGMAVLVFLILNYNFTLKAKSVLNSAAVTPTAEVKVNNDADEHGCSLGAGYSWCQAKQKCLKLTEEKCEVSDEELIKGALFEKNGWKDTDNITVTVTENDGKYAKGSAQTSGGGGYFFAEKVNGTWEIVADGNGMIMCAKLGKYPDFPKSMIPTCYDATTDKIIERN
ncbi:MAG TPA: hypothetical protein VF828_01725 [Patescibacteria group bacterium]